MQFLFQKTKKILLTVAMFFMATVYAQTCVTTDTVTTCSYNISDDGYAIVPIPWGAYPYYGRLFTHSIFFDNGVVSFYSPNSIDDPMRLGGQNYYAQPLTNNMGSQFNYSIMPLWTDLVNYSGSHTTETNGTDYLRYNWNNISQWGNPNRLNTFSLEIRPSGYVGIQYQQINISGYPITVGMTGDTALNEINQRHHVPVGASSSQIQNWNVNETIGVDCNDPLSNVNCPGYQQAFFNLQCSINALHSPACPGYAQAIFTQQCSVNVLSDVNCPGYAVAYLEYQCSLNALYSTTCSGYEQAYFTQQCNLDPLYDSNCEGYEDAFYVQQCNLSPLYDSGCTGYEQAYFDQQCSLNGLYDRTCPNYNESFAKDKLLNPPDVKSQEPIVEPIITQTVIEQPVSSASPADVTSPVQLVAQPSSEVNTNVTSQNTTSTATNTTSAPTAQTQTRTNRQALAEARLEAQRSKASEESAAAVEKLDSATSMEDQVAVQNVVLQAMGYNPAFDAYGKIFVPDGQMYAPFTIYNNQTNVDNRTVGNRLFGGSDRLHQEMVNGQYR
jgi:hypothetical protein